MLNEFCRLMIFFLVYQITSKTDCVGLSFVNKYFFLAYQTTGKTGRAWVNSKQPIWAWLEGNRNKLNCFVMNLNIKFVIR
jgi:hypothetical protein